MATVLIGEGVDVTIHLAAYDESEYPRDEGGKWAEKADKTPRDFSGKLITQFTRAIESGPNAPEQVKNTAAQEVGVRIREELDARGVTEEVLNSPAKDQMPGVFSGIGFIMPTDPSQPANNAVMAYRDGTLNVRDAGTLMAAYFGGSGIGDTGVRDIVAAHVEANGGETGSPQALAESLRGDSNVPSDSFTGVAAGFANSWAETSGDSQIPALAIQSAAAINFGADNEWENLKELAGTVSGSRADLGEARYYEAADLHDAVVQAWSSNTAAYLADNNVAPNDTVTLYRGVGEGALPEGTTASAEPVAITMNPLSSWTTSLDTAVGFAITNSEESPESGAVMQGTFQASDIIGLPFTGPGCLNENEVVVVGHPTTVTLNPGYFEDAMYPNE